MTGSVLSLENVIGSGQPTGFLVPDRLAIRLTEKFVEWNVLRQRKVNDWEEIRRYIFATDTTQTSNATLPWKNKTTVPKSCQIRDNLLANYIATLLPQRKNIYWEANELDDQQVLKRDAIINYIGWAIDQPHFITELEKIIADYIDFGNCFATVQWVDNRAEQLPGMMQTGFIGPAIKRLSPLDVVMNPTAESFYHTPKFVRSIISLGELREYLERLSTDETRGDYEVLFDYLKNLRFKAREFQGEWTQRDRLYAMDGFTSFRNYLLSDYCEVITFYGDWYDYVNDEFQKNRIITVVDRHKLIANRPNPSFYSYPPIFHVPWRRKQDNLWGMGPLDNLIGMQYRMDHVENLKADVWDFTAFPVQKIKGFVDDFTWQPGEKIYVTEEGDVDIVSPDVNALNANLELDRIERLMEEMAGAPREAMGFRSPGEKTKYEVQRLENAAARLFQNKIKQFEIQLVEPLLNAMLELARRNLTGVQIIQVFNDKLQAATFQELTVEDITGIGRIKPIAARHFAEQAELVQNLTSLAGSQLWPIVQPHFSGVKLAQMFETSFNMKDYHIVTPNIALAEQAEMQQLSHSLEEQTQKMISTPTGMGDDFDIQPGSPVPQMAQQMQPQPMTNGPG
ncbi:MAG TPA: hypothetical protein VGJ00_04050 [Rhabdochlamydiaceae bacterium]|jgi:hypothetical protein